MELITKINIIFSGIFIIGLFIIGPILYRIEMTKAKHEVSHEAEIISSLAAAVREYTSEKIWPYFIKLGSDDSEESLFIQMIPDYVANSVFGIFAQKFPKYTYKAVAMDPTNPDNRPNGLEVDAIRYYQRNPEAARMSYNVKIKEENFLCLTYPLKVNDKRCLTCHSDPKILPKSRLERYGAVNGMHWKLGEIVGMQLVSIPMSRPYQKARESLITIFVSIISIFTLMFISLNVLLSKWIVEPFEKTTKIIEDISLGKDVNDDFPKPLNKEMKNMISAIKRLKTSMRKMLSHITNNKTKN